jgi:hypothetical protein
MPTPVAPLPVSIVSAHLFGTPWTDAGEIPSVLVVFIWDPAQCA